MLILKILGIIIIMVIVAALWIFSMVLSIIVGMTLRWEVDENDRKIPDSN